MLIQTFRDETLCPVCGAKGQAVPGQTIKALLSVSLRLIEDIEYLFCKMSQCAVVYFSATGGNYFTTAQVRERVYQKEIERHDVPICYCFQYTIDDILRTPEAERAIVDNITAGIKAGQCACDLRNPQGSCCLGNVRRLIQTQVSPLTLDAKSDEV